jgi:small basic protein (TIGR04137 family)
MSLDSSLKSASSLVRHRNVLTRGERLAKLAEQGKWDQSKSPFGLPKVGNRKLIVGGKDKKEAAEGDSAAAPAAGGKAAPAAKGAAPAAKGAAPAKGRGSGQGCRRPGREGRCACEEEVASPTANRLWSLPLRGRLGGGGERRPTWILLKRRVLL